MLARYWPQNVVGIALSAILAFSVRDLFRLKTVGAYQALKRRHVEIAQRELARVEAMTQEHWRIHRLLSLGFFVLVVLAVFDVLYAGGFWFR